MFNFPQTNSEKHNEQSVIFVRVLRREHPKKTPISRNTTPGCFCHFGLPCWLFRSSSLPIVPQRAHFDLRHWVSSCMTSASSVCLLQVQASVNLLCSCLVFDALLGSLQLSPTQFHGEQLVMSSCKFNLRHHKNCIQEHCSPACW